MRHILVTSLVVLSLLTQAQAAPGPSRPKDLAELRTLRRKLAHRKRRMIFNNDGDDVIYRKNAPTPEGLLAERTTPLLGSQVDSIFYSNSMCFGDALHDSKVFKPFTSKEYTFKENCLPALISRGLAPIQIMAEFGRKHGIEVFWDMRMNDTHDAGLSGYGPYLFTKFKLDNPSMICGAKDKQPRYGSWSSVDYAQPEVRELAFRFFEEVCTQFDIDGIELDFFRHACFFKTVAQGGHATQAELDMMTDLLRRTRRMTEAVGLKRGRPILIAIRIPDSVEFCKGIGLDIETWLAEGLVDILSGTCYFRLNRWETLIGLGHKHDIPVYPCLSESRVRIKSRFRRNSLKSYRARAMRAWTAGADGIYIFNKFNPRDTIWRELGDPETLRTTDKLYFATVRDGDPNRYLVNGRQYRNLPILTPRSPLPISTGKAVVVPLVIGDDTAQAQREGWRVTATCHVQTDAVGRLHVVLNGETLPPPKTQGTWLDFPVPIKALKNGENRLEFQLESARTENTEAVWNVVYEGGEIPGESWQRVGTTARCLTELRDNSLLIADRGTQGGDYAFFHYRGAISADEEVVAEVRIRPLSGWSSLIVENGVHYEE
ncbi:MAG: hypothetical protein KAI66_11755, partial [Lentisphaeria bacterium]|nr:hypothetical protein [Lentisphaeria bacterium]